MSIVRSLKSVADLCPSFAHGMSHLPPFDFCSSCSRRLNVLLWRFILSLAVNLQPPSIWVFVRGDWHLVHIRDAPCFFLYMWICTPHATSSDSLLAM